MNYQKKRENKQRAKKIRRKQYTTIKPNQKFFDFYEELNKYFGTHMMPTCKLSLLQGEPGYFYFEKTMKMSENIIQIYDENICDITFLPHKNGIELFRLEMYQKGNGFGSIFMNAFTAISKKLNIDIYLIPADPGDNISADKERRRNFYHRFNFRRLEGTRFWKN